MAVLKNVVLVGAGHAHVGVLRSFGLSPTQGVRLTLITRQVYTPYSGMLPGLIAGIYDYESAHIDTRLLARFADARLHIAEATGLDLDNKRVICRERPPVPYDVLSIDIGATPSARDIPGVADHAIPVKPIDGFLARFEGARDRIIAAGGRSRIGVVGAGAGGVELILSMHRRLTREVATAGFDPSQLHFTLFSATEEILPTFPKAMRQRFVRLLHERGISVLTGGKVMEVEAGAVRIEHSGHMPLDEVFWTTAAEPASWLADTGLALDEQGFIRVAPTLQTISHAQVFAAGDVAMIEGYRLPRSGVYAVREARPLARNLRRVIAGQPLIRYRPQREAMYLISTGERYAIGTRNGITFGGAWVWKLKDWIDRRFMAKFKQLPERKSTQPWHKS
jgi:selenide,water dikinase